MDSVLPLGETLERPRSHPPVLGLSETLRGHLGSTGTMMMGQLCERGKGRTKVGSTTPAIHPIYPLPLEGLGGNESLL